jgi:hypothetical protein
MVVIFPIYRLVALYVITVALPMVKVEPDLTVYLDALNNVNTSTLSPRSTPIEVVNASQFAMFATQVAGRSVLRLLERQSITIPLRQSTIPLPGLQSIASSSLRYQPLQQRHLSLSSHPRPSRILEQVNRRQSYFTQNTALRLRTSGFNAALQKRSFTLPRIVPEGQTAFGVFARFIASVVIGLFVILAAILLHDSFTYSERHVGGVPTNPLALHPRTGGPKNLPIVDTDLSQEEDDTTRKLAGKPKLVIVGGGWGVSRSDGTITQTC